MTRSFEDKPATRERVPLLVGLVGPSSSGKTYSALRLATGIARVTPGEIYVIDTEARRALHYASDFKFRHVTFPPPFSPGDYAAAIEHCVERGAGVIVVDSMSHEHEGQGGLLEMHAAEVKRLAPKFGGEAKANFAAWNKPKAERRKMINTVLQTPCNFVFCFRAKPKLKVKKGKDPEELGYMPIAAEEFIFEMTVNVLLLPGAGGVPTWHPEEMGEKAIVKRPSWADRFFKKGQPLDEDTGEALARWAAGEKQRGVKELLEALASCGDGTSLGSLKAEARTVYKTLDKGDQKILKGAIDHAEQRLAPPEVEAEPEPELAEESA